MIAFSDHDRRREQWISGGWNLIDDDTPRPPESDPLASGQRKRWLRQSMLRVLPGFFSAGVFEPRYMASVSAQKTPQ